MKKVTKNITEYVSKEKYDKLLFLEELVNFLPVVICKINEHATITYATGTGIKSYIVCTEELIGKNAFEIFSIDTLEFKKALISGTNRLITKVNAGQRELHLEHKILPDVHRAGCYTLYTTDITAQWLADLEAQRIRIAMEEQVERLEDLNKFKDKIFSVIAHDLRGPVQSFTSLLSLPDEDLTKEEFKSLKKGISEQLFPLNDLIDTLFRYATVSFENRNAEVSRQLNLQDVAQKNIVLLQPAANKKNINIVNSIPVFTQVIANPEQVSIVLRNIIANAIKFTPKGGIILLTGTTRNNMVEIAITDTGIGMTPEQLNKLFTQFQVSTRGTGGEKGTGLGLLVCKEYIQANHGTITVSSELNKGTVFKIILPGIAPLPV